MNIVAIIPAYNEEKTIGEVVQMVCSVPLIKKVIVVSDGSTDNTALIAKKNGAKVINLKKNLGKGGAMCAGVNNSKEDILLFLDADLIGLKKEHIINLLNPIINNDCQMTVGLFSKGSLSTDLAHKITGFLSGQRAMKRELFNQIPFVEAARYGVETALTKYTKKNNIPVIKVKLYNLTHRTKENKLGLLKGFKMRLKMYKEIIFSILKKDKN